jgi:hypothetical protein
MGVELRPVFNPSLEKVSYRAEGKTLIDDLEMLDEFCAKKNLPPLSSFMDQREPPEDFEPDEDFDGDPDTYLDQACGPWNDWFSASEGLCAARGLFDALDDSLRSESSDDEALEVDLRELVRCLDIAVRQNAKFRLAVC